jgi:hypothetical protein
MAEPGYDENGEPLVKGVVSSHGVLAMSQYGVAASQRLEKVMQDAILQANQEGISNAEENSDVIRRRMHVAHQRELLVIMEEEHVRQMTEAQMTFEIRAAELTRAHLEHLANAKAAHQRQVEEIQAEL